MRPGIPEALSLAVFATGLCLTPEAWSYKLSDLGSRSLEMEEREMKILSAGREDSQALPLASGYVSRTGSLPTSGEKTMFLSTGSGLELPGRLEVGGSQR